VGGGGKEKEVRKGGKGRKGRSTSREEHNKEINIQNQYLAAQNKRLYISSMCL
jgi:hypothetical protein